MNWLDLVFLAIFASSILLGAMKGLAKVTIGLAATILGVLFASRWYAEAGYVLRDYVAAQPIANGLGFVLIIVLFITAGAALSAILSAVFKWAGITWMDRVLGACFGVLRAMLISMAIVLVGMAFPRHTLPEVIQRSKIAPYVVEGSRTLSLLTPDEVKVSFTKSYEELTTKWRQVLDGPAGDGK
jgi:membrane protein required for colicin V production